MGSAAYIKGIAKALSGAQISFDRFHVIQMALQAMDEVRRQELREHGTRMRVQLGASPKVARQLMWGMRRDPVGWKKSQTHAMHWLQRSNLKSARARRLKMALQQVYAQAAEHGNEDQAAQLLGRWISWVRRCRLAPLKRLAGTLRDRLPAVCVAC